MEYNISKAIGYKNYLNYAIYFLLILSTPLIR